MNPAVRNGGLSLLHDIITYWWANCIKNFATDHRPKIHI